MKALPFVLHWMDVKIYFYIIRGWIFPASPFCSITYYVIIKNDIGNKEFLTSQPTGNQTRDQSKFFYWLGSISVCILGSRRSFQFNYNKSYSVKTKVY